LKPNERVRAVYPPGLGVEVDEEWLKFYAKA